MRRAAGLHRTHPELACPNVRGQDMIAGLAAYAAGVAALTFAEVHDTRWQLWLKPLLAVAFVATAVVVGGLGSTFALLVTAALAACAVGDTLLLSRDETPFLLGMVAFGLGHLLFAGAFWDVRVAEIGALEVVAALAVILVGTLAFARSGPRGLGLAAGLYSVIIAAMLGASLLTRSPLLIGAALAFVASDAVVAQDRFKARRNWHPLLITPLYFGAQMAFALSTGLGSL